MKRYFTTMLLCAIFAIPASSQDFNANAQTAKTSYAAGNLENARFAMQQMMQDLDMASGKEVLKALPTALGGLNANASSDGVNAGSGFAGVVIERSYQSGEQNAKVEIISQSPLLTSINAILALPFVGGSNGNRQVIKIDGYKALIERDEVEKGNYTIQVPLSATLVTITTKGFTGDIQKMAAEVPMGQIAQKLN